jgi:hypothetical protein
VKPVPAAGAAGTGSVYRIRIREVTVAVISGLYSRRDEIVIEIQIWLGAWE